MTRSDSKTLGSVPAMFVHVLLLVAVLGQVVYLASRHRSRWDLTSDGIYTLTSSTRELLGKLDKQLLVEAYFSPKEKLPVVLRDTRAVLDNFLDELVQLGKGRVVVQRFDPNSDKAISDRCQRVAVQPVDMRGGTATSVSFDRHWQGLRFVYGGGKQKVVSQIAPQSPFHAEAVITPAIKEVVTASKRKFGYMEWPASAIGQQQATAIGWNLLRTHDQIAKRYEFQNFKDEDGALLPEDCQTLFLYRPKDLSDRHKYVLDQFVVRGGTLVVFADAAEYAIGPQRTFHKMPMVIDAPGSTKKLEDQLRSYGIDWRPKVLADLAPQAHAARNPMQPQEYLAGMQMNVFGQQGYGAWAYPYFFHAMAGDWSTTADQLATKDGKLDAELAARYRKLFGPGMPSDEFLFKAFKQSGRGPGFYWPTWVGLRQKTGDVIDLPEGVTGTVLLWSSPLALAEDPQASLDALGQGDTRARQQKHEQFVTRLRERLNSEPRMQAPLMVDVRGKFRSFFAGAERPKRPSEIKEEEAKKAAEAAKAEAAKTGEAPKEGEKPQDPIGPEPPKDSKDQDAAPKAPPEADLVTEGDKPGRIVVIGDSDFLRDDLLNSSYAQAGGPVSVQGGAFFVNLLDWLAEDRDLVELQSRATTDRALKFVDPLSAPAADPRIAEQRLLGKTRWLRGINILVPGALLAAFGLIVLLTRRAQKRAFLESMN